MSDLYVDGLPVDTYLKAAIARWRGDARGSDDMFWSTQPLSVNKSSRETLQVEFSGYRMVNHISFLVSRFPHMARAEYWNPEIDDWSPLREQVGQITPVDPAYSIAEQRGKFEGAPVSHRINDSYPVKIDSARRKVLGATHPQHFGSKHWVPVTWRCVPVYTRAIRLWLVRPGYLGTRAVNNALPPVGPDGGRIAYSLAVKDLQVGYRVNSMGDVPDSYRASMTDFATSPDLLGSRLSYRLKTYSADNVIGEGGASWRSEPQPVNYAVVNLHVDVREPDGSAQVIDRFYVDPLTVGPTLNIYYTADDPDSDFEADDSLLTYPAGRVNGAEPTVERLAATGEAVTLDFPADAPSNIQFDNGHLQWDPRRPWWMGLTLRLETETGDHPWFAFGLNTLRQNGRAVEFVTTTGESHTVSIPSSVAVGDEFSVALLYRPDDPGLGTPTPEEGGYWAAESTVTLAVGTPTDYRTYTRQITPEALGPGRPETMYVGSYTQTGTTPSDMALRGLFLKIDDLPERGYFDGFMEAPHLFYLKSAAEGMNLTRNALIRIHPTFWSGDNLAAAVGGPGDRYEDAVWTPIPRDYTLRQGFLRFPPVKARHFKFEFTNLVHMHFENLVPIRRKVRLFPPDLVEQHQRATRGDSSNRTTYDAGLAYSRTPSYDYTTHAPGVQTMMDMVTVGNYASAVNRLREIAQNAVRQQSRTEAYVAGDPLTGEQLRELGWVWSFTPWHIAASAPRWPLAGRHRYETVAIDHDTKTGFYVGIKHLKPYRVDYLTDDDTDIYEETFADETHLGSLSGVVRTEDGITAVSSRAVVTSKVFPSTRNVRGVQFASVQSDAVALLPDDGFVNPDLSQNWAPYGDASIQRMEGQGVLLSRGVMAEGGGGGGMVSGAVWASTSGRVYAAARVTAQTLTGGAVRLEIVSLNTGSVLAAEERILTPGEEAVFQVGYEVGSADQQLTYGDLEAYTYAGLEDGTAGDNTAGIGTYGDLETDPIGGPVFARLRQLGHSRDRFMVERLSLFDQPVVWQFSVDGGVTWYDGMSVRNNPEAVLTFPTPGKDLVWRALIFHEDADISALTVRPWYGGLVGSMGRSADDFAGPNRSVIDDYPDTIDDPMWGQRHDPVPGWWHTRDVANQFSGAPNILVAGEVITP